ncbi:peptidylprolyl isomerase [Candidatus Berkelbacteria bacterium]|nr:peptidylprolyl isomerase [Candidatus Berkelbacteria bacterium]
MSPATQQYETSPGILSADQIQKTSATIVTEKGTITIRFFPDEAPRTVSNFVFLAEDGFYDGLTFHRVEPAFVVQGGDPEGDGTGGPGYTFEDESVTRPYLRGTVAMANRGPDTNGSQFFIVLEDAALPPQYTIFGEVASGMETVDTLVIGDTMQSVTVSRE